MSPDVQGGQIVWDLTLDDKGFADGLSKAKSEADKTAKSINKSFSSMSKNIVSSLDKGSKKIAQVGTDMTKSFTVPIVASVGAVGLLVSKAGKLESVTDSFNSMTQEIEGGGDRIVASVKKAVSGTISEFDIMTQFITAKSLIGGQALGESGENFERMAVLAKKAARATGQDVTFMMDSIVKGVGRGSAMILDNLGITVDATKVYADYAATVGKSSKQLSAAEKKQALLNAVLEKGETQYKDVAVTAGGVSSSFARLKVIIEESSLAIGTSLIPVTQELLESLTPIIVSAVPKIVSGITKAANAFQGLSPTVKTVVVAVVAFLAAIGPAMVVVGSIGSAIVSLASFFSLLGSAIGLLVPTITLLISPLGLVVAAVAGLILVIKNWDAITQTIKNTLTSWGDTISDVADGALKDIQDALDDVKEKLEKHKKAIKIAATVLTTIFGPALVKTGIQAAVAGAKIATRFTISVIKAGAQAVIAGAKMTASLIANIIKVGAQAVIAGAKMTASLIFNIIRLGVQSVITGAKMIASIIASTISYAASGWASVAAIVAQVAQFLILNTVMVASAVATGLMTAATWALNAAIAILTSPITLVILAILALIAVVYLIIQNWDFLKQKTFEVWESIKTKIAEVWENIKAKVSESLESLKTRMAQAWENIKKKISEAWAAIKTDILQKIKDAWDALIAEIGTWPGRLFDWGKKIGKALVDGFWDSLKALKQKAIDAINAAKSVLKGESPPKEGPFRNIDKWGFNVGSAWVEGMASAINDLDSMLAGTTPALALAGGGAAGESGGASGGLIQNINVNIDRVNDEADVDAINREIAFKASLLPR